MVDVGCGDNFTVVLTTDVDEKLPYIYPKGIFNEKNLKNIKERTKNINDVLLVKKNLRNEDTNYEELLENLLKEDKKNEEKLMIENNEKSKNLKQIASGKKIKYSSSLHVSSNKVLLETSKHLLNDITFSQIQKNNVSFNSNSDFKSNFSQSKKEFISSRKLYKISKYFCCFR